MDKKRRPSLKRTKRKNGKKHYEHSYCMLNNSPFLDMQYKSGVRQFTSGECRLTSPFRNSFTGPSQHCVNNARPCSSDMAG